MNYLSFTHLSLMGMNLKKSLLPIIITCLLIIPVQASNFSWVGSINDDWYATAAGSICNTFTGQHTIMNNWGLSSCGVTPPFPGSSDTATINSASVRLTGSASVGTLTIPSTGFLHWTGGDLAVGNLNNQGTFTFENGNSSFSGIFNNSGSYVVISGYGLAYNGATFNNNNVMNVQTGSIYGSSGVNIINNYATFVKSTGNLAYIYVPVNNTGLFDIQAGSQVLSGPITSSGSEVYNTAVGATLYFRGSLSGTFQGNTLGSLLMDSGVSITGQPTSINFSTNGLTWTGGDFNTPLAIPLTNNGIMIQATGNVNFTGKLINSNTYYQTSGYTSSFADGTINNSGTYHIQAGSLSNTNGTNLFNNSGTLKKETANAAYISLPMTNSSTILTDAGTLFLLGPLTSTSSALYPVTNGATLYLRDASLKGPFNGVVNGIVYADSGINIDPAGATFNFTNNGFTWTGGDTSIPSSTTLNNTGVFTQTTGNVSLIGKFTNNGTYFMATGYTTSFNSATFQNNSIFEMQLGSYANASGTNSFQNTATFKKTTGNTANITVPITNSSLMNIQAGALLLLGPMTSTASATYPVAAGASLYFRNSSLEGTYTGSVLGNVYYDSGINIASAGASINFSNNGATWLGGDLNAPSTTALTNNGIFVQSSGNVSLAGKIINAGTYYYATGYSMNFTGGSIINNGTFEMQAGSFGNGSGTNLIQNNNTFNKTTGGTSYINTPIVNNGTMATQAGALIINGPITSGLTTNYPTAGTLYIRSSSISGPFSGAVTGSVLMDSGINIAPSGAKFNFTGNGCTWTGGDLNAPSGNSFINAGLMTQVTGNASLTGKFVNTGYYGAYTGYSTALSNCTFTNNGTFEIQAGGFYDSSGTNSFINTGTIKKTTGNNAVIAPLITNSGTIEIDAATLNTNSINQSAGKVFLNGGAINLATLSMTGGKFTGSGGLNGNVVNTSGSVEPGNNLGTITINGGNYTQGSGALLKIEASGATAGTTYDQLQLTGTGTLGKATLAGTLDISFLGSYSPPLNTVFTVLTANSIIGRFDNLVVHNLAHNYSLRIHYNTNSVTLTVIPRQPGDTDGNGCVDDTDLLAIINSFLTHPGDQFWNPSADLDNNGVIDDNDLLQVINNFLIGC